MLDKGEVQLKSICKTHFRKITEFPFDAWIALYIFILLSTVDERNIVRIRFQDFKPKAIFEHAIWGGSLVKHFNMKFISQLYSAKIICPIGIWSSPHNLGTSWNTFLKYAALTEGQKIAGRSIADATMSRHCVQSDLHKISVIRKRMARLLLLHY